MKTRDEYVAQLKADLDRWNAEAAQWEKQASAAQSKQLAAFRARRDEALYQLRLLEGASSAAWQEFSAGADKAWDQMKEAMTNARSHFVKSPAPGSKPKS